MKPRRLKILSRARRAHHELLCQLPYVTGTALGYKRRAGKLTRTSCVVVYVRRKVSLKSLRRGGRVPASLAINGKRVATDVVCAGPLRYHFGPPPWYCRDGADNQGSVAALCSHTATGEVFALTCAHCIAGQDDDPSTSEPISLWDQKARDYATIGATAAYQSTSGFGLPEDFGFSDWGLFSVDDNEIKLKANAANPLQVSPSALGTNLKCTTAHGMVKGTLVHLNAIFDSLYVDIVVEANVGAMYPGDSGTLWREAGSGAASAVHAIGLRGNGSPLSFCMRISRIASILEATNVVLLDV